MKVFFSLIILSLLLATCQGEDCDKGFGEFPLPKDGKRVMQRTCRDTYDGKTHLVGSTWKTAHCMTCECTQHELKCCEKYSGDAEREGCRTVANPETCQYDYFCAGPPMEAAA